MINFIWCGMIVIGIIVGTLTGNIEAVSTAAIEWAETAVELSLGLIGVMALWLGLMKIAEEAGIVRGMGLLMKPIMVRLFPIFPVKVPTIIPITIIPHQIKFIIFCPLKNKYFYNSLYNSLFEKMKIFFLYMVYMLLIYKKIIIYYFYIV